MNTEMRTGKRVVCPSCGQNAKRVSLVRLRALLKEEFASQLGTDDQPDCESNGDGCNPITADTDWRFCDSQDCDVVYFSEQGDTTFTKSQLKVAVGVKETTGKRPLCYCFDHSVASIKEELKAKGQSDALADIRAKMKDPGCHCETSNPSGSCCLGSVTKGIQIAKEELTMANSNLTSEKPANSSAGRGEKIAKIGTLASAVMASACCWLPLVLLAVGVSGAGVAATLEAYRSLFIVVTVGFLGAAFYLTYRPKKAVAGGGHDCCATEPTDDCCAPAAKVRFNMMTLNKAMLWVVAVLAIAFVYFPSYVGMLSAAKNKAGATGKSGQFVFKNHTVFKIDGMTCEGCATTVAFAIRQVPGVRAVEVDYKRGLAIVDAADCCLIPEAKILSTLQQAGYSGIVADPIPSAASASPTATQPVGCCALPGPGKGSGQASTVARSDLGESATEPVVQLVLEIDNMTCEDCASVVTEAIRTVPGVFAVEVDYKNSRAVVGSDICCPVPKDKVLTALDKAGYRGTFVESNTLPASSSDATNGRTH